MRIRIVFSLKNKGAWIPFHHQSLLTQFIKDLIQEDENLAHNYPFYNFSGIKGQTKISRQGLHFYSSKVTLVISSYHAHFMNQVVKSVFSRPEVQISNLRLIPESIENEEIPALEESVKYVCISPIVLVDSDSPQVAAKKFISPDADMFSDLLYESTMLRMEQSKAFTAEQIASFYKFQVIPDQVYLKKIKAEHKKFARIYNILHNQQKIEVRGYTFPFVLYAAPQVQDFVFKCGLGTYTNYGYGMVDLANTDPIARVRLDTAF